MNCFIWILLLLGCCGNCGSNNYGSVNTNCGNSCERCSCNRCEETCGNMIQPRMIDDCGCRHHNQFHDNDCMTPPPVPRFVKQNDDCGCNN